MRRPTIRFFNTYEPVITIYRDLAPALAQAGNAVRLVVARALYRADKQPLETLAQQSPGVEVQRIWTPVRHARSRLAKLQVMASYIAGMVLTSLFGRRAALNVFLTQPPLSSVWGGALSKLRGQPFACILMDIYPEVMIRDGLIGEDGLVARIMRRMVRWSWRRADAIVVIGRCMRDFVVSCGVSPAKVHVIPNWNDEATVQPVARQENALLAEHGLSDSFVVLYSGNLGVSHQFRDLLDAAQSLGERGDIRFVIVGSGSRLTQVQRAVEERELGNVSFLPYQPFELLAQSLGMANVHYVCLREGFTGLVVPSKTYPALASGRPVIFSGSSDCEIARSVSEHDAGTVLAEGDSAGLAEAIRRYADDPQLAARQGRNASAAANGPLSREKSVADYVALFTRLATAKDRAG